MSRELVALVTTKCCFPFCCSAWATHLPSGEIAAQTDVPASVSRIIVISGRLNGAEAANPTAER